MNLGAGEHLHALIARMYYRAGLPFHVARNPYFVSTFQFVIICALHYSKRKGQTLRGC